MFESIQTAVSIALLFFIIGSSFIKKVTNFIDKIIFIIFSKYKIPEKRSIDFIFQSIVQIFR